MGQAVSFLAPGLGGIVTSDANPPTFATSYAFSNSDQFGIPATVSVDGGADATDPIVPTLTVPAANGADAVYTCNPFPPGVTGPSLICPGATNTAIEEGTVYLNLVGGDPDALQYYTGAYAFSVVKLKTVGGGGQGGTTTTTTTTTLDATTTTVSGSCASGTGASSGTRPVSGTGVSSRPSGTASRSGSGTGVKPSISTGTRGPASSNPSGSAPSGSQKSASGSGAPYPSGSPSGKPSNGASVPGSAGHGSSVTGKPSGSNFPTITNPSVSTTSTSTHYVTTTLTTVITTYVPCSSAIATQGGSTIYSSSLTASEITKTITSTKTEFTVICPVTEGPPAAHATEPAHDLSPVTTIVFTKTTYVCPTPSPPPPPCPTDAPKEKRDAGFSGPDVTLTDGETPPVVTKNGGDVETKTETSTKYSKTVTETAPCSSTPPARRLKVRRPY